MTGRKAAQERFSEESLRVLNFLPTLTGNVFLKLCPKLAQNLCGTHSTQQAWINSRNLTTIATHWKHRQPIFLHPTDESGADPVGRRFVSV
jgi:hypothetical protein